MINDRTIEEIKNRMDIYEVVSDFVQLKKAGSSYKALSPFTDEKTPSFNVSPSKGIFKCFSTGKGGDAITFLMEMDGLTYVEALRYLADKYGVAIQEESTSQEYKDAQSERESLFIIMNFAKEHFVKNLWEVAEGRNIGLTYFKERGFSEDTIKNFDLGYSLDQWQGLIDAADSGGYNQDYLEKAGLKIVKDDKAYDRFRGRVVFPIHNITGKVIAFGARKLKDGDKKSPKYINSPETELYHKSKILYGIFQAKNEIRNLDNCYLVEGYTDVISLAQAGVKNVVASSGTALTEDQIKLIKRFTGNVTVLFDGDKAGIKASMRGIDMMLEGGLNVKSVPFPEGEDPDSYSKALGSNAFKEYLSKESKDFITFKTDVYMQDGSDPIKRADSIREIVNSIAKVPDPIRRTVYIQECSSLLKVDEQTLITELNKLILKTHREGNQVANVLKDSRIIQPSIPIPVQEKVVSIDEAIKTQERDSLRMLINYGEELVEEVTGSGVGYRLVDYFMAEIDDIDFQVPVYREILNLYRSALEKGNILSISDLVGHDDRAVSQAAVDISTERYEVSPNWNDKYEIQVSHERDTLKSSTFTNILRLKFRIVQKMINENMEKIKLAQQDSEIEECLQIQKDLKAMEMTIAQSLGNVTTK
ncbi:DNA primase [Reichenbachiella versicolor]|uniref:DNA primase n=1 Tax=Reichenbachiella versicolor TaxID=1821036 RepID=UPI000D6DCB56|nr:DNA primase [Reichenbachiella versicolor]